MIEHGRDDSASHRLQTLTFKRNLYPQNIMKVKWSKFKALGHQTSFHEFHFPFGKLDVNGKVQWVIRTRGAKRKVNGGVFWRGFYRILPAVSRE